MKPADPNPEPELQQLLNADPTDGPHKPLHLIENDRAVRDLVRRNPGSAAARYEFKHTRRGYVLQYPLFRAVALGASTKTIRLLAAACPAALSDVGPNGNGGTPLHAACMFGASLEVVRLLVELCPAALVLKARYGYTPLHTACNCRASDDVIEFIATMHPRALEERTKLRETPTIIAERRGCSPELMATLAALRLEEAGSDTQSQCSVSSSTRTKKTWRQRLQTKPSTFVKEQRRSSSTACTARSSVSSFLNSVLR
eukprot:CAMPEP_0197464250 /NCGR_PEP_ID=MMETSP1175-20131217/63919_1 /TAXON_ID=1003142 /ORGANISM="Triceratium dubium, Strain CCMP147" /LENGTH=256 /DNA_ID=CAMNT_0043000217 /DNA_START=80 /DNA_END=850 /DNA_ORIENTATION=+